MGLTMDEIHNATIPSGPTSGYAANGDGRKKSLNELIASKGTLEAQLSALGTVLDNHGVNMNTSLTTFDGYPRADIDVAQIRTTRAQIIRLKNDHKALMQEVEKAVHEHFAARNSGMSATTVLPSAIQSTPVVAPTVEPPFARVNTVTSGSPAAEATLQPGDQITKFGYVNWANHERLSRLAQVVQQNENRPILVRVLRGGAQLELHLTPRKGADWRGLLGCHLLPL